MSDIQSVFSQINDIEGTISSIERSATQETSFAHELALNSLRARRDEFVAMAAELSQRQLIDVCDYRIVPDLNDRFPAKAVAEQLALPRYVHYFLQFSKRKPPLQRATHDAALVGASTLNVGYAYSGSLGIVLYVPNDQLLPMETDQDKAIHAIFELADQRTAAGVRDIAERFGRAAVKRFYEWSEVHIDYGLSADIKWKRGQDTKDEMTVQPAELLAVKGFIDQHVDTSSVEETVEGILVALDVTRHSFKLSFPDAKDMRGTFDEQFNWKIPHQIPGRYRARVVKRSSLPLWSEVETVAWTLLDLHELK